MPRTEVGRFAASELPPGSMRMLKRPPFHVLVANVDGRFLAIENACPHSGWSLAEGRLDGQLVKCLAHGWVVDLLSGRVKVPEGVDDGNPVFEVVVEGDSVVVYEP